MPHAKLFWNNFHGNLHVILNPTFFATTDTPPSAYGTAGASVRPGKGTWFPSCRLQLIFGLCPSSKNGPLFVLEISGPYISHACFFWIKPRIIIYSYLATLNCEECCHNTIFINYSICANDQLYFIIKNTIPMGLSGCGLASLGSSDGLSLKHIEKLEPVGFR